MKLFSWFIKENKNLTHKQPLNKGVSATIDEQELENEQENLQATILANELSTFNNNTMWPIAKVKTATMIIKKPQKQVFPTPVKVVKAKKAKPINTSLVSISVSH